MKANDISRTVIGCAIKVHKALGPGLLESAYQKCMEYELKKQGLQFQAEKSMPLIYEDVQLNTGYRLDLLVENLVVVELKSVEALTDVHRAQVITYLKLSECKLGLLINFNVALLKLGVERIVNDFDE